MTTQPVRRKIVTWIFCLTITWDCLFQSATVFALVIDPAAGGEKNGIIGCGGLIEKELTFDIAKRIRNISLQDNWRQKVYLTRSGDIEVSWKDRVALANEHPGHAFVSIHAELSPSPLTHGIRLYALLPDVDMAFAPLSFASGNHATSLLPLETVALENFAASDRLLTEMTLRFTQDFPEVPVGTMRNMYAPLLGVRSPSLMIGVGFLSSPIDCRRLLNKKQRQKLAKAIFQGIVQFSKPLTYR